MKLKIRLWKFLTILSLVLSVAIAVSLRANAEDFPNKIAFDNKSGNPALVKLIGHTPQIIEVPQGQSKTVNAAAGEYYILVRYGINGKFNYTKGSPFSVTQTNSGHSTITITLCKMISGNHATQKSSRKEFDDTRMTSQDENQIDTVKGTASNATSISFDDNLLIQSIPPGATVSLVAKKDEKNGWQSDKSNYKGKTPLRLSLASGEYLLNIRIDTYVVKKIGIAPKNDDIFSKEDMFNDGNLKWGLSYRSDDEGKIINMSYWKSYNINKKDNVPHTITAIFSVNSVTNGKLLSLLPKDQMFEFDFNDAQWEKILRKLDIKDTDVAPALRILRKTGTLPLKEGAICLEPPAIRISSVNWSPTFTEELAAVIKDIPNYSLLLPIGDLRKKYEIHTNNE